MKRPEKEGSATDKIKRPAALGTSLHLCEISMIEIIMDVRRTDGTKWIFEY